jgi:hypothetical protein
MTQPGVVFQGEALVIQSTVSLSLVAAKVSITISSKRNGTQYLAVCGLHLVLQSRHLLPQLHQLAVKVGLESEFVLLETSKVDRALDEVQERVQAFLRCVFLLRCRQT